MRYKPKSRTAAELKGAGFQGKAPKLKPGEGYHRQVDSDGKAWYRRLPAPAKDATKRHYEGRYKLAIVDALNVLGTYSNLLKWVEKYGGAGKGSKVYDSLLGTDYELQEAYEILYAALGIILDFKDPAKSYEEFTKIRALVWRNSRPGRRAQAQLKASIAGALKR